MLLDQERDLLLNSLPGMAYRCSVEAPWVMEYVSPGVRFLCSHEPEDLVSGRITWGSLIHADDLAAVEAEVSAALSARRQFTLTYRIVDAMKGERWVLERGEAIYRECGRASVLVGFILDITDQKRVEQRLRESQEHYRAAVELNPQIPWTADPDGAILEIGPRWWEVIDTDEGHKVGQGWIEVVHPDDREAVLAAWRSSLATGDPYDQRYRLRLGNGSYRWVRSRGAPRRDTEGKIIRWYGTVEDVQAQVEAEFESKEAEQRYALAATATGDIVWDWDMDKGVIRRVGSGASMLGYAEEKFETGLEWLRERIHPDDADHVRRGLQKLMDGGGDRWSDEYRLRRADGTYAHIFDRGYLVRSSSGDSRRMVGAMQDISERKAAEQKVEQLQAELLHLSQNSAMGAMASTLAHELNQPLTAAANYLVASRRMTGSEDEKVRAQAESGLAAAEQQIHRAGEIIRRMRGLVRKQPGHREPVSLRALVNRATKIIEAGNHCPGVEVRTDIGSTADTIRVDPIQIEQVLLNLMRNACQAMVGKDRPEICIVSRDGGDGFAEIQVRDRGVGLSQVALDNLFTAYAESTSGGMGVGLSISRTIVEAHGGRIWAESNSDGGAAFSFLVPLASAMNGSDF